MGLFGRKTGRTKTCAVGLYGKHPTAGDFLRIDAGGDELERLDQWLSAALVRGPKLIGDWERRYAAAPLTHFIWPCRGDEQTAIVGCMVPSNDQSGRRYPLIIFSEVAQKRLGESAPILLFTRFLRDAEALLLRRSELSRDELLGQAREIDPLGESDIELASRVYDHVLDENDSGRLFESIAETWPEGSMTGALFAVQDYGQALGSGNAPTYALRCPLNQDALATGATWLALLKRAAGRPVFPWVLWSRGTMLIGSKQPPESALAMLWDPGAEDNAVYDLATTGDTPDYQGPAPKVGTTLRAMIEQ